MIANQAVVQAQATARANVARANGESQAIKVVTVQLKQSPQYLQWLSINRWNGQMHLCSGQWYSSFFQITSINNATEPNKTIGTLSADGNGENC